MKGITLWQPWASLVALGLKQYETRSWPTVIRGPIAVHAAKRPMDWEGLGIAKEACALGGLERFATYWWPKFEIYGAVVAIATLTECYEMTRLPAIAMKGGQQIALDPALNDLSPLEMMVGLWEPGRFAWKLENVQKIEPVFMNGRQGLWNCELDLGRVPV